jgi:hypothetical protein
MPILPERVRPGRPKRREVCDFSSFFPANVTYGFLDEYEHSL